MQLNKIILTLSLVLIGFSSIAQVAIDPTGKRFMKPKERTKFGGPTPGTHKMPKGPESINITFVEIQIDPSPKGGIEVTVRGTKSSNLRGCESCNIAGRIIVNGEAAKELTSTATTESTKLKQAKNEGSSRRVSFISQDNTEYAVVSNKDGGFLMSTVPNGTYSIWVGGKKVISDYILVEIEPTPEELKKAEELRKEMEAKKEELKKKKEEETPTDH